MQIWAKYLLKQISVESIDFEANLEQFFSLLSSGMNMQLHASKTLTMNLRNQNTSKLMSIIFSSSLSDSNQVLKDNLYDTYEAETEQTKAIDNYWV